MTVKAFIKSEEKKRSKDTETPAVQSVEPATPADALADTQAPAQARAETEALAAAPNGIASGQDEASGAPIDQQADVIPTIEVYSL